MKYKIEQRTKKRTRKWKGNDQENEHGAKNKNKLKIHITGESTRRQVGGNQRVAGGGSKGTFETKSGKGNRTIKIK